MESTQTQTPGGAAAMMGPITTVHLILIAVLAVLTIAMIVWGVRLKAQRKAAEHSAADHREAIEAVEAAHDNEPAPAPAAATAIARAVTPAPTVTAPTVIAPTVTAPVATAPVVVGASPPIADTGSDLTRLKGLGPKLAGQLAERGLTRIEQIAALSPAEAAALDTQLGSFNGRLSRDRWVDQATLLAAGDTAGYEAQFGKL